MKKIAIFRLGGGAVLLMSLLQLSCGGTGGTVSTPAEAQGLAELPSLNVGEFINRAGTADISVAQSNDISVSKAVVGTTGTFSRSGCECRQIKKEMITQGRQVELNNCYIQKIGTAKGLVITDGAFSHFEVNMGGGQSLRVRMGNFGGTFKMDLCETRAGVFTQLMSYDLTQTGGNASGSIVEKHLEFGETDLDQHTFTFDVKDYTETGGAFNFSTATITTSFNGRYGAGSATLLANNTANSNKVTGDFKNGVGGNDFTGRMYCQFDNATGAAKYSVTGNFPAFLGSTTGLSAATLTALGFTGASELCPNTSFDETAAIGPNNSPFSALAGTSCTFTGNGTEPFALSGSGTTESATVIASTATGHFDTVNAQTLGSGTVETPTINFTRTWDCTAPTNFVAVDASDVNVATCTAIETELRSDAFERTCHQQQNTAEIQESQANFSLPPP